MSKKIKFARTVARFMHAGQTDKSGAPYIEHVERVANDVERRFPDDEVAITAAWLHDTVEDTPLTLKAIRAEFGHEVAEVVGLLTRTSPTTTYYTDIADNESALRVKLSDLDDNMSAERMNKLPEETQNRLVSKYKRAIEHFANHLREKEAATV